MNYIAIIPARGGSKGIKNKNLQLVGGKSLVARAILVAKEVVDITRIIVSTDSEDIAKEAFNYGAEVHKRRAATSSDEAKTISVLEDLYVDMDLKDEVCILLQPTSPLRQSYHIQDCIRLYEENNLQGSVISVTMCEHHPYKTIIQDKSGAYYPIRHIGDLESPRQKLPKAMRVNGAVYLISFKQLLKSGSFFCQPQSFLEMSDNESIDIDDYTDLVKANLIIEGK